MDSFGFGIVILEVHSEEKTIALLENEPVVKEGILTATIFPYRVALLRK